ncbi:MAG: C40 family peptidase [Spirochaetota bacterium]
MKKSAGKIIFVLFLLNSFIISCAPPVSFPSYSDGFSRPAENISVQRKNIMRTARSCIGVPYRSGGVTPRGFDCSGMTTYVYKKNGISLPRTAAQQYRFGKKISIRSARPGDLVFFNINGGQISHVGIYCGKGEFIHAPSTGQTVRTDSLRTHYWKDSYFGTARYLR